MCTWLVVETIDYFQRNGSEVYACVMDMSKAFDRIKHSDLFWKLFKKGMPPVYVRLLLVMYEKQKANVRWNNVVSETFSITNGVKQGAVLSPILFCIYIDSLFSKLRRNRTGCWLNDMYAGIMGYADDIWLLSPTQDGLQEMVHICSEYSEKHNLSFSTHPDSRKSKTKCIAFTKSEKNLQNIVLDGYKLPWVRYAKHLGHKISCKINGLGEDLMEKRALYINRVNELNQEFYYAHPSTKIMINNIFNSSFYGSQIWDLFCDEATRLEKSWNISQRILLGIPRTTHRYFIEPLSGTPHIMISLYKRFLNFISSIKTSSKSILKNMLNLIKDDCQSTTGRNLRKLLLLTPKIRTEELSSDDLKKMWFYDVPPEELWKVRLAKEIMEVRNKNLDVNLNTASLNDIMEDILI